MIYKNGSSGFMKYEMPVATDWHEMRSRISDDVAGWLQSETAERELPNVVVIMNEGIIQNIIADRPVEAYIVDCDTCSEGGHERINTVRICGLPVTISKSRNVIAPRLVNKVVRKHPATVVDKR